jgi:hypothetical protein
MAKGDLVSAGEEIVRALHFPYWDAEEKRASTQAFMQTEVSVSRTAVLSYDRILSIFKSDIDGKLTPGGVIKQVEATASLTVGEVLAACGQQEGEDPPAIVVQVIEDPVRDQPGQADNDSHALIEGWDAATRSTRKKLTKGMANRLRKACRIRLVE